MFIIILLLMTTPCWGLDSIGPVFHNTQGISTAVEYKPTYQGQKDRYSVAMADDEVLVSKAKHESNYYIPAKDSVVEVQPSSPITVTTHWEFNKE